MSNRINLAERIALYSSLVLLLLILWGQYMEGVIPCALCLIQRWSPLLALILTVALVGTDDPRFPRSLRARRNWIIVTSAILSVGTAINVYLAGTEHGWWDGISPCLYDDRSIVELLNAGPVICRNGDWTILGMPATIFSALLSCLATCVMLVLALPVPRSQVRG